MNQELALLNIEDQNFLEEVFSLEHNPDRHKISQEKIDQIFDRVMSISEKNALYEDFSMLCNLKSAFQLYGDYSYSEDQPLSITDKAYRAFLKLAPKYPNTALEFEGFLFGQEQTVQPRVLFESAADIMWNPDYDINLKNSLIYNLQYQLSFSGSGYIEGMVKQLDFDDPDNYIKVASFLELIKRVAVLGASQDYSNGRILDVILVALETKKDQNSGSYLLNIRLKQVIESINKLDVDALNFENDSLPFLVTDKVFGLHYNDKLLLSDQEDFEKIQKLKKDIKEIEQKMQPPQELVNRAIANGESIVSHTPNRAEVMMRRDLQQQLQVLLKTPVDQYVQSNNNEERKLQIYDYSYLMKKSIREFIQEDLDFNLADLSIKEQFFFIDLIKSKTEEEMKEVKEFVDKHKESGFKAFLSLESDPYLGDKIVSFGNENEPEIVTPVFEKYSEIVDQTFKIENFIEAEISDKQFSEDEIKELRESLMSQAKDVLVDFIDASNLAKEEGIELSTNEVEQNLSQIKTDTILLTETLRSMKSRGEQVKLPDIKNIKHEGDVKTSELTPDDISEMKRIYQMNYADKSETAKILLDHFNESLESSRTSFATIRYKGEITGFYRLEEIDEDSVYFASFNINQEFRGSGLGEAVMLEKIDQVAQEKIIHAETDSESRICSNYIERGFVGTGFLEVGEVKALKIIRNEKIDYATKRLTKDEIIEKDVRANLAGKSEYVDSESGCKIISADKQSEFDFQSLVKDGYIVTRYFKNGKGEELKWYVVLEKNSKQSQS